MEQKITWTEHIKCMFTDSDASCMIEYGPGLDLHNYDDVKKQAVTIWEHVALGSMPLGGERWSTAKCDTFRKWIDQGMLYGNRQGTYAIADAQLLSQMSKSALRVRKDILTLTNEELEAYRDAVASLDPMKPDSLWAKCGNLHGQWCLHYQEAFLFWHRAHLLYVENLLGMAIPYWNWMAPDAPDKGIPRAFSDPTYVARDGAVKPNPLYRALGVDGKTLTSRHAPMDPAYVKLIAGYQKQVAIANSHKMFSIPQGGGFPWANLPDFTPDQQTYLYDNGKDTYDRYMEQPHDNVHGWIGGDMANNAKTAFDPIFYSHHSNIDRLFYNWMVANPQAQYTTSTAILPFASGCAHTLKDPYHPDAKPDATTIGDLARDVKKLGYCYEMPKVPDNFVPARVRNFDMKQAATDRSSEALFLSLPGVKCSPRSHTLYVFLNATHPTIKDANPDNPNFCAMQHRSGMGTTVNTERCITRGITQTLDITDGAKKLGLTSKDLLPKVDILVIDTESGQEVCEEDREKLPGVKPVLYWVTIQQKAKNPHENAACCK